ncbi:MAG: hypothetical protein K2N28_01465, partial [Muribaculaceae bacterium]|nr:hypothetical protein [Muribaculaceae bacterium]
SYPIQSESGKFVYIDSLIKYDCKRPDKGFLMKEPCTNGRKLSIKEMLYEIFSYVCKLKSQTGFDL